MLEHLYSLDNNSYSIFCIIKANKRAFAELKAQAGDTHSIIAADKWKNHWKQVPLQNWDIFRCAY